MKVLFLVRSLGRGGAERQVVGLAAGMHGRGCTAKVLAFYGEGELDPELRAKGIQVESLNKRSRWDVARFMWRLRRYLRKERPHVVYSVLPAPNIVAAIARIGIGNIKLRMYEVPAHGAMLLCDKAGRDAHESIFSPGTEAIYYDSVPDAIEKAEYFLTHESERLRIAQRGFQRVSTDYDWELNLRRLLDWAMSVRKRSRIHADASVRGATNVN